MALPAIAPYDLPSPTDLPANRVDWCLRPDRAVLLLHDLQNYFLRAFTDEPIRSMTDNIARLLCWARANGVPVVYSAQPGGQTSAERGLQQDFWGPGLPADPDAAAVPDAIAPEPGELVLTKWKYSAFVRTELSDWLAAQGRDQLVIAGVYAHIGVLMTAADAWMRDIPAFVVADATADFSPEQHRMALEWAAGRCAVVTTTDAVVTTTATAQPVLEESR